MEKLLTLTEKYLTKEGAEEGDTLAARAEKIVRVERRRIGDGAVMFGMFAEGPEQSYQRTCETLAELRGDADRLTGFQGAAGLMQGQGFIERNAEHVIGSFELLFVGTKDTILLVRERSAPVISDRHAAG